MDKVILSLIIAILSYVCIVQSNLINTDTQEAPQVQEELLVEVSQEEAIDLANIPQASTASTEELIIDPKTAATIKARFIDIDQNRDARSDMWRTRVDRLLTAMRASEGVKQMLYKNFLGTNTAFLLAGVLAVIIAVLIRKLFFAIENFFFSKMHKYKTLKIVALYLACFTSVINKFIILFGISICVYLNISNDSILSVLAKFLAIYFFWLALSFVLSIINTFFDLLLERAKVDSPTASMLIPLGRNISIIVSVILFVLILLENFGLNVSAIMASLGIGGAALAFASKDTIANFFGSVSLIIDRPFVVGHEVKVANWHGFVEKIGLRSTRIRTLDKTLICLPNSILANEYIENLSLRKHRRVGFSLGLVYSTSQEELQSAIDAISAELKETEGVVAPITVAFDEFADSSLNINIIFYTQKADFASYIEIKNRANFAIMKAVRRLGLSIAFPSRSLYLENDSIKISKEENLK